MIAAAVAESKAMVWEPLPSSDGPEADAGAGDWERAGIAERLSAAGAATAAADVGLGGSSAAPQRGEARVNPPGHVWVSTVSRAMHAKRLQELWEHALTSIYALLSLSWLMRLIPAKWASAAKV